jgi:hypothetical protein
MPRAHGWSEREVERRSAALARLLRRAWRVVSRAVSGSLHEHPEAYVTAANAVQPIWTREAADGPALGYIENVYLDAAEDVLLDVGAPGDLLVGEDLVQLYLRTASNRLRGVGDHAWERVRRHLLEGQRLGESPTDIAARIAGTGGISDARALTIARTEVHAAAESAAWEQARFVDSDALKIWLATNDERTRPTHRAAEGQAVALNELFVVGDSKLRFPGDPEGAADETINCRCTLVFDFEPASVPQDAPQAALVAAADKKWNPTAHPRGKDGRFIKKGAVQQLLSKKKPLLGDVAGAVNALDQKQWNNLTAEQKQYVTDSVAKLPTGSQIKQKAESDLAKFETPAVSAPAKLQVGKPNLSELLKTAKHGDVLATGVRNGKKFVVDADMSVKHPVFYPDGRMRLRIFNQDGSVFKNSVGVIGADIEDLLHENGAKFTWDGFEAPSALAPKTAPKTTPTPTPTPAPQVPSASAIPAHKGGAPGSPAKVTTALIWGKYEPGTTILEAPHEEVTWDGKKYRHIIGGQPVASWTKKDAYAQLKDDSHWTVPGGAVAEPPTVENFAADMKKMWQDQWEKGLVTTEEFEQQFGEPPQGAKAIPENVPPPKTILGQSGMTLSKGQDLYDKGLMTLDEFEDEFGLSPEYGLPPEELAELSQPSTPTAAPPTPPAGADWPELVKVSGPKGPTGKPASGPTGAAGHNTQAQLTAAATKPANFNPNAGVQTGKSAFYAALQSHAYDESDKKAWLALRTYQSHAADEWNRALRYDVPLEQTNLSTSQVAWVKAAQPKLDEMFAESALPATLQVWRGVRDPDGTLAAKLTKGTIFEDKGYVSTGTERSVAESFAGGSGGLLFDVEVPKGEQGLVPTKWSGRFLNEWELLLPRGTKFEVLEEPKKVGGYRIARVRVVTNEHDDIKAPEASPEAAPEPVAEPNVPETAPETPAAPQSKDEALNAVKLGETVTPQLAMTLVPELTVFDWNGLSDEQKTNVVVAIDDALDAGTPGANVLFKKLNDVMYAAKQSQILSAPQVTPTPTPVTPGPVIFQSGVSVNLNEGMKYLKSTHHPEGTVVAQSVTGKERLVATDVPDRYNHEILGESGTWVVAQHDVGSIAALQTIKGNSQSQSLDPVWMVPKNLFESSLGGPGYSPVLVTPDSPTTSTPASSVPTPSSIPSVPSTPGASSTPEIPLGAGHKLLFKQGMKNAKVGYWSKPEAIWEQVQEFRKAYPQFSALQILKALDEQLKTKDPTPYQTKMLKWLGTSQGKLVAGQSSTVQSGSQLSATPSVSAPALDPATSPAGKMPSATGISHISETKQAEIYAAFKKQPGTYATSTADSIYAAAQKIADENGLNVLQALKVIDQVGAQKASSTNKKIFEKKITKWLKSKTGAASASPSGTATAISAGVVAPSGGNQRIPPLPAKFDPNVLLPKFAESSKLEYPVTSGAGVGISFWPKIVAKHGDISSVSKGSLKVYTGTDYSDINDYLWGNTDHVSSTNLGRIKRMQAGMRPSVEPIKLWRGTSYGIKGQTTLEGLKKMVGQTWRGDGFTSTSAGSQPAPIGEGADIWFEIDAPPGTPMAWLEPFTKHKGEYEMLLAAGLHYRITSVEERNVGSSYVKMKIIVKLRVVPEPTGGA